MAKNSKLEQLEEICRKHQVDPASLPEKFLREIGKNYTVGTEAPELGNSDLKTLVEHHGAPPEYHELLRKIDRTLVQYEEMLKNQAKAFAKSLNKEAYDVLTGCYARKKMGDLLHPLIELARSKDHYLSVMMLDIDHFKSYNDTYGHGQGDITLETVGKIINSIIKTPNKAIRYGGEEFLFVLPETDAEEAEKIAEKVRSTIEKTVFKKDPVLETYKPGDTGYVDPSNTGYKNVTATLGVFTYHTGLDSVLGFYDFDQKTKGFDMIKKIVDVADQSLKVGKNKDQRNQVHIARVD